MLGLYGGRKKATKNSLWSEWKRTERVYLGTLVQAKLPVLLELNARLLEHRDWLTSPEKMEYLFTIYLQSFGGGPNYHVSEVDQTLMFFKAVQFIGPATVSLSTFLYILRKILDMLYTHPAQVTIDGQLLEALYHAVRPIFVEPAVILMWISFLSGRLQYGRQELLFIYDQWKNSTKPCLPKPCSELTGPKLTTNNRAWRWFTCTPIPLLEQWLQSMEHREVNTYKIQLPSFAELLYKIGPETSMVRIRMLERAFKLGSLPVYVCWRDHSPLPVPPCLERIILQAPAIYYYEAACGQEALIKNTNHIPTPIKQAFLIRSPPIFRINPNSVVINQLYASPELWRQCIEGWASCLMPYVTKDIFIHVLFPYLQPHLTVVNNK